jgi:hypothetical protein
LLDVFKLDASQQPEPGAQDGPFTLGSVIPRKMKLDAYDKASDFDQQRRIPVDADFIPCKEVKLGGSNSSVSKGPLPFSLEAASTHGNVLMNSCDDSTKLFKVCDCASS